ncbi:MAG: DNA polymerase I [Phycisphaeraceae bacterium]
MPVNPPSHTLYLIDGHAQMFRAFFAIRGGMTSPVTGEPTNALYAFTGMLLKLFRECRPEFAAMVVDPEGPTFREEIYPDYKANRDEAPEDFVRQIPRMFQLAELFGLPILQSPGFEADDVMATLADRVSAGDYDKDTPGLYLKLVAKDKDLEQVLNDRVCLYDVQTDETLDVDALIEKRGIRPEQVIDYQTLIGDSTDNIPGVKGIGPKTARKLLEQFGTLDNLLANLDQLKGKQKENLIEARDNGIIDLTRKLVTLRRDTPIDFSLTQTRTEGLKKINGPELLALFRELGFNRHVTDLKDMLGLHDPAPTTTKNTHKPKKKKTDSNPTGGLFSGLGDGDEQALESTDAAGSDAPVIREGDYRAITTHKQLDQLVRTLKKQKLIAVDTETIGLGHDADLCGVCLAWEAGQGVYVPVRSPENEKHLDTDTVLNALRPVLENEAIGKTGHNLKYDYLVLKHAGVRMRGMVFDTMIAGHLLNLPGLGMDDMALAQLNYHTIPISRLIGERGRGKKQLTMDRVPLDRITPYAAEDADISLRLYEKLRPMIEEAEMASLMDTVETPLIEVLAEMEDNGIRVDPAVLDQQKADLAARIEELRDRIHEAAGGAFNVDSPKQLAEVLFTNLGLPVIKRKKTGPSTDVEVLEKLADLEDIDPVAQQVPILMLEYRQLTKLVGTYLGNLKEAINPRDGRVHARFHQTGTATGRLSSSDPNLQNIPIRTEIGRQIRKAFVAEPGHVLISADYSQIELRMLAHLSGDDALKQAFMDDRDIHAAVAARVYNVPIDEVTTEQRANAKIINFGIVYGITPYGLARRVDNLDNDSARQLIEDYKRRFPGIDTFLARSIEQAKEQGWVKTILGRRREIKDIHAKSTQARQLGERLAINSVVQGSAADLIKLAMVNLHRRIETEQLPMKMLLQIHDELVFETPESEAEASEQIIRHEMEHALELDVPLKVDVGVGPDWFAAK